MCFEHVFLKVHNVGAEQMSSGRLFQATGPATQNARLPSCGLVRPADEQQKGWQQSKLGSGNAVGMAILQR